MAAISHSSALTRIQQILRISAQHFAIRPHQDHPAPRTLLIASEFKDPLPLRWTTSFPARSVHGRHGISI